MKFSYLPPDDAMISSCQGVFRVLTILKKWKHDEQTLVEQRYCPLASLSQG
jgi:hypothetical protein